MSNIQIYYVWLNLRKLITEIYRIAYKYLQKICIKNILRNTCVINLKLKSVIVEIVVYFSYFYFFKKKSIFKVKIQSTLY